MTTWWWVRHGPTHAKAAIGWTDLPADLSDTSRLDGLKAMVPDDAVCLSSDLSRARDTLGAIRQARPQLAEDPRLREFNFGTWEGLGFDEIARRDPDRSRAYWQEPGDAAPPEGESWNDLSSRVGTVIDAHNGSHRNILAVAHFGVILTAVARAGNLDPRAAFRFKVDPLSVTALTWHGDDVWTIHRVNHLP